jgi:hypothetical protein
MVPAAGYPGTMVIPAVCSILSLLALKLCHVRRGSRVEDIATDRGAALFAGLSSLPKTTALTSYSYELVHEQQKAFLGALERSMIAAGLLDGRDFDLTSTRSCTGAKTPRFKTLRMPSPRPTPPRPRDRHPRHPAATLPPNRRTHPQTPRHDHRPPRPPRLLTRPVPARRRPLRHHRPPVGRRKLDLDYAQE